MQSAHCQMRVSNAVSAVQGTTINAIEAGQVTLGFENEAQLTEAIAAIEKAGYKTEMEAEKAEQTMKFETSIHCSSCASDILDNAEGVCHWGLDTESGKGVLSVHSNGISEQEVINRVKKAGYQIQTIA